MTIDIDPNGPLSYLLEKPAPKAPDNALGKDAFLQLLVAQMKYQNPMEPADATDFIAQTAQFTLVEQMENMATSNEDMLAGQLNATAASLIGKDVQWNTAMGDEAEAPGEGRVEGVRLSEDGPILIVDGWEVPLTRVTAFGHAPAEGEMPPTDQTQPTTPPTDPTETSATSSVDVTDPAADGFDETLVDPTQVIQDITEELGANPPTIPSDPTAPAA